MNYIAIDYGEKWIGVAVSDDLGNIATPAKAIKNKGYNQFLDEFRMSYLKKDIEEIIIGVPKGLDDKPTKQEQINRSFGKKLEKDLNISVIYWNEDFTTQKAYAQKKQKADGSVDSYAAFLMLQEYLNYKNTGI